MIKNSPQHANARRHSFIDRLIMSTDTVLRSLSPGASTAYRPSPAETEQEAQLSEQERRHIAGLMRINHTGEVCAQALYQGQAVAASEPNVETLMNQAAQEEVDHLAWCEQRLKELDSAPSHLNPIWYSLSFGLGAIAGIAGDRWSLGFVAETEHQVCRHLDNHLKQVPHNDRKTRKILQQMRIDEAEHATHATQAGGTPLPAPIKGAMSIMSKVMTKTAYRL